MATNSTTLLRSRPILKNNLLRSRPRLKRDGIHLFLISSDYSKVRTSCQESGWCILWFHGRRSSRSVICSLQLGTGLIKSKRCIETLDWYDEVVAFWETTVNGINSVDKQVSCSSRGINTRIPSKSYQRCQACGYSLGSYARMRVAGWIGASSILH